MEAVLERYGRRAFLDIELKVSGIEAQVLRLLSLHAPKRGFLVSSFLTRVLRELRRLDARVPLAIICENTRQLRRWRELPIQTVIVQQSLVTPGLLREVHEAAKTVWVWTVNRASTMARLAKWGVDGIISDKTELLVQTLSQTG